MLINGLQGDAVSIHDRGLLYGDGVFRTLRVHDGRVLNWQRHYKKLQAVNQHGSPCCLSHLAQH